MFNIEGKFEAFVRRLHSRLDTTTVTATLTLMVREADDAIDKQRRLIALERLTQRDDTVSLGELHTLEKVKRTLSVALLHEADIAHDEMDEDWGTVVPLRAGGADGVRRRA